MYLLLGLLAGLSFDPIRRISRSVEGPLPPPEVYVRRRAHRDDPLVPRHRQDGVVAGGPPGRRVDEKEDVLVDWLLEGGLAEHDVQFLGPKRLLAGVERQPAELALPARQSAQPAPPPMVTDLDEVRPVLHDRLELDVPVRALPPVPQGQPRRLTEDDLSFLLWD